MIAFNKRITKRGWDILVASARFTFKALMMILLPGPIENKTNEIYHDRTRWIPRESDRK